MTLKSQIEQLLLRTLQDLYSINFDALEIQHTRKEFNGEYTLVIFPLIKQLRQKPEAIGESVGNHLLNQQKIINFNVVKGFLNLNFSDDFLMTDFITKSTQKTFGISLVNEELPATMVEYSSPNTNKPIHLGHVRNNLLGYSVAQILAAAGHKTVKIQVINDRGIHICKSMVAWKNFGNNETPESSNLKGDHLVGKYYVLYDKICKEQINELVALGKTEDEAKKQAPIFLEAQEMLRKWEKNDPETIALWKKMNTWVYAGFEQTYKRLGVTFDDWQYESKTYLLGKDLVNEGLKSNVFYTKEDGSVWIDLTDDGLDEKIVMRSDGTSVYITQDMGTAVERFNKYNLEKLIYVVGNEQDYHFKVLFLILQKLGYNWANSLKHLSYGMVDLPSGKMKSREGTVVDADDLMQEIHETAKEISTELGKIDDFSESEKEQLYETVGMGALKYQILKVDPKKRILFDPKESIDFNGNTGPFIQYAYARIQSLLKKEVPSSFDLNAIVLNANEKEIIRHLNDFEHTIKKAAHELSPALIANYVFDLVKLYNHFYQNHSVLKIDDLATKNMRLYLSQWVANVIESALKLLGIDVVERM